nr:MAG TPA: hypothetical protein [Caudoviricetes sp.]
MGTTPLIKVCKPSALIFSLSAAVTRPRRKRGVVVDCTIAVVLNHGVLLQIQAASPCSFSGRKTGSGLNLIALGLLRSKVEKSGHMDVL